MLRDLYFGKIIPWERRSRYSEKQRELIRKIELEEQYLAGRLPSEDSQRLQALANLYATLATEEEGEVFSYGFTMGALLMMDMAGEAETMGCSAAPRSVAAF